VTVYRPLGRYAALAHRDGPGLLLAGGGALQAPPSIFTWLHDRIAGAGSGRAGNVVIIRAEGDNYYDRPFMRGGNFASVQTVLIRPCASRTAVDSTARIVDKADAVFFAGGDQADYVAWKGSALMNAVKGVYARGGVVGGGSAGLAIQGAVVFDAVTEDRMNVETTTKDAVADPLEPRISFTTGLFKWPSLAYTLTDTHLVVRDRLGRMIAFLARILQEKLLPSARTIYGLGIDQASAVVVDADGKATVLNGPGGLGAFLVRARQMPTLTPRAALHYEVEVTHLRNNGQRFDLQHKTSPRPWFALTVDGTKRPIYSRDPYRT
jgi:cyanophycinase-like exopeptidase